MKKRWILLILLLMMALMMNAASASELLGNVLSLVLNSPDDAVLADDCRADAEDARGAALLRQQGKAVFDGLLGCPVSDSLSMQADAPAGLRHSIQTRWRSSSFQRWRRSCQWSPAGLSSSLSRSIPAHWKWPRWTGWMSRHRPL